MFNISRNSLDIYNHGSLAEVMQQQAEGGEVMFRGHCKGGKKKEQVCEWTDAD